jgi:uncharacterized protein YjlB
VAKSPARRSFSTFAHIFAEPAGGPNGFHLPEFVMYLTEALKRTLERATGRGRPTARQARAAVHMVKPTTFSFEDDGSIPNNPVLPAVVYAQAVRLDRAEDPAALLEALFKANLWGDSWRNGIYDYVHYHSSIHEVLGIARGHARVRLGGDTGTQFDTAAGDVLVLPAGTGHQCLMASADFLVVGAYPPAGTYDLCRGRKSEHAKAIETIPATPLPTADPVFGKAGPLIKLWAG